MYYYRHILFTLLVSGCLTLTSYAAHIVVLGSHDREEVQRQIQFYADLFAFDSTVSLLVTFTKDIPQNLAAFTQFQEASGSKQIHIKIHKYTSPSEVGITLAHEMVHARQFVQQDLQHKGGNFYEWKGKDFTNIKKIPYRQRGWEQEALQQAHRLYYQYKKQKRQDVLIAGKVK